MRVSCDSIRSPHSSFPASSAFSRALTSPPCRSPSPRGSTPGAVLRRRPRDRPLRGRARRRRRRARPLRRRGRPRAHRGRVRVARPGHGRRGRGRDRGSSSPIARFTTATSTLRSRKPTSSSGSDLAFPRWSCTPVECYGVVARLGPRRGLPDCLGELPGPVHAALGRRGRARAPRLQAPADHAARLWRLASGSSPRSSPTSC